LLGEQPPVTRYEFGDEGSFYAEFLTPLVGPPKAATSAIAGVTAQALRYLEILIVEPWSVLLGEPEFPVGPKAVEVRIANATSYLAQKILILGKRSAPDRAKDVLYLHDTLVTFGRSLAELEKIGTDRVFPVILPAARRTLQRASEHLFAEVTDPVRKSDRPRSWPSATSRGDRLSLSDRVGESLCGRIELLGASGPSLDFHGGEFA
jgi:Nucleotidyltransferase